MESLREFFQHERDEELGRWRWPEDPNYYVRVFGGPHQIEVVNERKFVARRYYSASRIGKDADMNWAGIISGREFDAVARAYFDAHPEPKPGADANVGEIWEFKTGAESKWMRAILMGDGWRWIEAGTWFDLSVVTEGRRV